MKVKHVIVFFFLGIILLTIGTIFKMMHWPYGNWIIVISSLINTIAGLLVIWKVLSLSKSREFLNS